MAKQVQVPWCLPIYNEFVRLAMLSDFEAKMLEMRIRKKSRLQIADALHTDVSTVDDCLKNLKRKYDNVQRFSDILPPRIT